MMIIHSCIAEITRPFVGHIYEAGFAISEFNMPRFVCVESLFLLLDVPNWPFEHEPMKCHLQKETCLPGSNCRCFQLELSTVLPQKINQCFQDGL